MVNERLPGPVGGNLTCRGMYFPGVRMPFDSIVNLSPDTIRDLVLPMLPDLSKAFGGLCMHFCTAPAPAGHVLPVLLESDAVVAVDNWQGPDVFIGDDEVFNKWVKSGGGLQRTPGIGLGHGFHLDDAGVVARGRLGKMHVENSGHVAVVFKVFEKGRLKRNTAQFGAF